MIRKAEIVLIFIYFQKEGFLVCFKNTKDKKIVIETDVMNKGIKKGGCMNETTKM